MKELIQKLDTDFDDAEGWIRIVAAAITGDDLTLKLSIKFGDDCDQEVWEVVCRDRVEESLCLDLADTLVVSAHSPLLKPFMEAEVPIMFSENSLAPEALFGIVCSCCIEVMGRPDSIARFINATPTIDGISSSRYGLLGRFPESLAARILDTLKDKPIKANSLEGFRAKRWDGSKHVEYQDLQVLEIGSSYILAQRFSAHRISDVAC